MKFHAALLFLIPLAIAGPAKQSAEGLPDLSSASEGGFDLASQGHGEESVQLETFAVEQRSAAERNAARTPPDTAALVDAIDERSFEEY
ncbi:hypothetical protein F66182_3540 [Fusarium sp. NRRL 66182]|nr:hypothetical protein F66182_3540 [Fusarium sp. NRRL 66182]